MHPKQRIKHLFVVDTGCRHVENRSLREKSLPREELLHNSLVTTVLSGQRQAGYLIKAQRVGLRATLHFLGK